MKKKAGLLAFIMALILFTAVRAGTWQPQGERFWTKMSRELCRAGMQGILESYIPCMTFVTDPDRAWLIREQIDTLLPFYGYVNARNDSADGDGLSVRQILLEEAKEETVYLSAEELTGQQSDMGENGTQPIPEKQETSENTRGESAQEEIMREEGAVEPQDTPIEELLQAENEAAQHIRSTDFVPHTMQREFDPQLYTDYEKLLADFYTVDANTMTGSSELEVQKLLGEDMTVSKNADAPQILIFHTHSQENFADSVAGDESTSIVGVGDRLAQLLTETYGYGVLHHTASYDLQTRDDAYSRALPGIEGVLAENPSIQVVIDLHRDEMPEQTRLVTELDGRPTARFMFFNGLSRTKKTGNIAYLYNENLDANLAFSFQMQKKAYEYYPGLTRKIYLKGYRYNMHLKPRFLLIELGAQNNTVEEAMNACEPLAHILDMVLSGQ